MEWSKLKNIVLLILVVTNLCLLMFVIRQAWGELRVQQRARANAVEFLAQRGITVMEEQIPSTAQLLPRTVERDLEGEGAAAAVLLRGEVSVESLGGEVYRYLNANGSVQFHSDGAFSASFAKGSIPQGDSREKTGLEVLESIGFEGEVLSGTEDRMVVRELWQEYPLFSQQVTLVWEENCLTALTGGRRLVGTPVQDNSRTPMTEATALIRFRNGLDELGDVCSQIKSITQGYVSVTSLTGPMGLSPVWRIVTDTGVYQMDLLTGTLSRVVGTSDQK